LKDLNALIFTVMEFKNARQQSPKDTASLDSVTAVAL
jgi:hypothetical protein